jgi:integrase
MNRAPKFVQGFVDRHGRPRYYFRRVGFKTVPLPGMPWSPGFMEAYEMAMSGQAPIGKSRSRPGTVAALVSAYFVSEAYLSNAKGTQRQQRQLLERFRADHGDKRYALLKDEHVKKLLAGKKPFAWRNAFKALRALLQFAVASSLLKEDPTAGIKGAKIKTDGHRTWSDAEIEQFERRWPMGTREHLAMTMGLYTLQRRGDVIRMGRQHVRDTPHGRVIAVEQEKTGVELVLPILPELQAAWDAMPANQLTYLTTANGGPFVAGSLSNWFAGAVKAAGLQGLSFHGLRKAGCRRFAEAGVSVHQIAAWSGHATLRELERYTKAAERTAMAWAGVAKLEERTPKCQTQPRFDNRGRKTQ